MKLLRSTLMAAFLITPIAAFGQSNLGEVLDASGKLMAADDLKSNVVGHTIEWKNDNGLVEFQARANPDGTLQGHARGIRGGYGGLSGTWKIMDDGQFCMTAQYSTNPSHNFDFDRCAFWFRTGDNYWSSQSKEDRSASVKKCVVSN